MTQTTDSRIKSLLSQRTASAAAISGRLGVPRAEVERVLRTLTATGQVKSLGFGAGFTANRSIFN